MAIIAPSSALALAAAVFIASQAVTIQYGIERSKTTLESSPAFTAAFTTIVVSIVIFWSLLLAQGVPQGAFTVANAAPFVVAGLLNPAVFRLLYFRGIEKVGASVAAAFMAMNPLVATVLAVPVLGEEVTLATGVGVLCIVGGGVVLQALQDPDKTVELDVVTRQLASADARDLLFPIGSTVFIGISYVLIKFGLNRFPHPVSGTAIAQSAAFVAFLGFLVASSNTRRRVTKVNRSAIAVFALAGVFTALGQLGNFYALEIGTAVTVVPLFNTFPLLVLVFTYGFARQVPKSPMLVGGVLVIVVGAALIEVF